jgi:hypothetical protein
MKNADFHGLTLFAYKNQFLAKKFRLSRAVALIFGIFWANLLHLILGIL